MILVEHNGKLYIYGGYRKIWIYDPEISKWETIITKGASPYPRQGHISLVINNRVYIFSGFSENFSPAMTRLHDRNHLVLLLNRYTIHDDLHVLELSKIFETLRNINLNCYHLFNKLIIF